MTNLNISFDFIDSLTKKPTVDDLLRIDPSEIISDVLTPTQVETSQKRTENSDVDFHEMLKQEINEIKKRYKENHQNYRLMDLVKLTENCRRILILQVCRKYTRKQLLAFPFIHKFKTPNVTRLDFHVYHITHISIRKNFNQLSSAFVRRCV